MISRILPGLRHVRTPLIVGYMWFGVAWLLLSSRFPTQADIRDRYSAIDSLLDFAGPTGVLVAVSFLSYIVGSLNVEAVAWLQERRGFYYRPSRTDFYYVDDWWNVLGRVRNLSLRRRADQFFPIFRRVARESADVDLIRIGTDPENGAERQLADLIIQETRHQDEDGRGTVVHDSRRIAEVIADRVVAESYGPAITQRLLVSSEGIYTEYDRLKSESELRFGLLAPLVALAIATVAVLDWTWVGEFVLLLGTGAIVFILRIQGRRIKFQADSVVRNAIASNIVSTPTLDLLAAARTSPAL